MGRRPAVKPTCYHCRAEAQQLSDWPLAICSSCNSVNVLETSGATREFGAADWADLTRAERAELLAQLDRAVLGRLEAWKQIE